MTKEERERRIAIIKENFKKVGHEKIFESMSGERGLNNIECAELWKAFVWQTIRNGGKIE